MKRALTSTARWFALGDRCLIVGDIAAHTAAPSIAGHHLRGTLVGLVGLVTQERRGERESGHPAAMSAALYRF
jgi:hypothetical protein